MKIAIISTVKTTKTPFTDPSVITLRDFLSDQVPENNSHGLNGASKNLSSLFKRSPASLRPVLVLRFPLSCFCQRSVTAQPCARPMVLNMVFPWQQYNLVFVIVLPASVCISFIISFFAKENQGSSYKFWKKRPWPRVGTFHYGLGFLAFTDLTVLPSPTLTVNFHLHIPTRVTYRLKRQIDLVSFDDKLRS